jgi:DNA polymerase I-like protein with 3'-5' exonuclease and polymerase domains
LYSQIELRVFAWYCRDPNMLDAYRTGQDIHSRTAWDVFELGKPFKIPHYKADGSYEEIPMQPITVDEVKDKAKYFRSQAKSVNFGQ